MRTRNIFGVIIVALALVLGAWMIFSVGEDNIGEPMETVSPDDSSVSVVADNMEIPWEIVFLPSGDMLVTERYGSVKRISDGHSYSVHGVRHVGEGGLLGMALHPDFERNNRLYLYLTSASGDGLTNRVERYTYEAGELRDEELVIGNIPGAAFHDGGRIAFGPDGYLYITTGDAGNPDNAQDKESLAGKILRVNDDGSIPSENPFGNAVYSYGHRNPQGLAWDNEGRLWATEHGRSGLRSGLDELNLIEKGKNYGWPEIEGDETREGMENPIIHSGSDTTWAPAGLAFKGGSLFFGGLRGEALYEVRLSGGGIAEITEHFKGIFGRVRAVVRGPDNALYMSTSNTDGRGKPDADDDKIVKVEISASR